MNEHQQKAVAEITSSKRAASSIKAAIKYILAKSDFVKNSSMDPNSQKIIYKDVGDYVNTAEDVRKLKGEVQANTALLKQELESNREMIPEDVNGNSVQTVKDEIIEL